MSTSRRIVVVASGSSPDRAIAIDRLLREAADRCGWSERLEIRVGGVDGGAGRVSDAGLAALAAVGIDATGAACPDLGRRPALLDGATMVICDRGDVADVLVDWDEASEAQFLCIDEVGADTDGEDLAIADEIERYRAKIDEVLRRIVADANAA